MERVARAPGVIPAPYRGWWRITSASQWSDDMLDALGPALISITGTGDRLRLSGFLANVRWRPGKAGLVFAWSGTWALARVAGSGDVKLGRTGQLHGRFEIACGDRSSFVAERTVAPDPPIQAPLCDRQRSRWP
jgi:hypothetical protein